MVKKKIGLDMTELSPQMAEFIADRVAGPTSWALGDQ